MAGLLSVAVFLWERGSDLTPIPLQGILMNTARCRGTEDVDVDVRGNSLFSVRENTCSWFHV